MRWWQNSTKATRRWVTIAVLSFGLTVFLWPAAVVQRVANPELRGTWMTHFGVALMSHTTRLDNTIAHLAKEKVNALYPAVWNHGHTLHSSAVMQKYGGSRRNPWLYLPLSGDLLKGLVTESHRQQLRLIPWFEYGLMIPLDATLVKQHPDWLTMKRDHTFTDDPPTNRSNPISSLSRAIKGGQQAWLNPFHPEVQQFLTDLITEVVQQYEVDGIQLDDHFGLPIDYGYDSYTVKRYRDEHNGQAPPSNPADPEWMKWRADRLTQLMTRIQRSVKAARPQAVISLSPNAPSFAYRKYLQDWPRWVDLKLLDEVVVQLYRNDLSALKNELDRPNLKTLSTKVPLSVGLYTGPFNNAKAAKQIQQETELVRSSGYAGTSLFCWETTFWLFKRG
jgi:uncharacterized lipoprotein YddW (UPF0748 family)